MTTIALAETDWPRTGNTTMTTATKPMKIGRFTIEHDACPDGCDWHVMAEGECYESFETRAEATRAARELDRAERAEELRGECELALADCDDPATLAAVLAL